jgi:uncharacterized protein YqgC (DUF456 family)
VETTTIVLLVLAFAMVLVGVVGTVLPALPGPVLVFAGLVLAAWAEHFGFAGLGTLAVLGVLTAATFGVDFVATALGARKLGATPRAATGAALGTLVGIFFGLPGVLIGPFAGAVLAELSQKRTVQQASRAGLGAWIGMVFGAAAKLALVFAMIGIYAWMRLF